MQHLRLSRIHLMGAILIALVAFAACTSSGDSSAPTAFPTLTPIPSYNFVLPSATAQIATPAPVTATPTASASDSLDPDKVAKGKDRYTALTCNTCHGDSGEGTDKG